jgi:hypothetical protein
MALSDYLTPEQLEIMLNETYGDQQTQDFIRPNPLQFQYPFIPSGIMNTGSVMYDEFPQGIMTAAVPQQSFQDFYGSVYEPYDPEKDDYQIRQIQGPEKKGIAKLMEVLGNIPTPLNLLRKAFEGVGPGFIGPKGSRAYGDESLFSTFGRSRTGAEFFQNVRDRKARQEAAARGAAKQADQARIDAFRAIRDSQPSGGGGGGGIGSSYGGAASPGSKGPGGSDEWGSF